MEFKKVTISLPKNLYEEGTELIQQGWFSNFSDLVRSGIRNEFKEIKNATKFDERTIYRDESLISAVTQSRKEAKQNKGKHTKTKTATKKYLEEL
ncbi:MAG: ribbon-helix-helix domain-containing protein [Candidatus Nanoarchaeia archaeon]